MISDANNEPKAIPYIGEKVLLIQYTNPDVKDINDKLSDAVNAKKKLMRSATRGSALPTAKILEAEIGK